MSDLQVRQEGTYARVISLLERRRPGRQDEVSASLVQLLRKEEPLTPVVPAAIDLANDALDLAREISNPLSSVTGILRGVFYGGLVWLFVLTAVLVFALRS